MSKLLKFKDKIIEEFPQLKEDFEEVSAIVESSRCRTCKRNKLLNKLRFKFNEHLKRKPESSLNKYFTLRDTFKHDFNIKLPELRPTCYDCVRKHLADAIKVLKEVKNGYSTKEGYLHFWYAMADLNQASEESVMEDPGLAQRIRKIRLRMTEEGDEDKLDKSGSSEPV